MYQIEFKDKKFPIEGGKLDLSGQDIEHFHEIKNLERITYITHLILNNNSLTNFSELKDYPNLLDTLESLIVINNRINSLDGLENLRMENLNTLILSQNKIHILKPMNKVMLPNLKNLSLNDNEIDKIEDISSLKNLVQISLGNNNIKTIDTEAFHGLSQLKYISLQDNNINSIDNFQYLSNNLPKLMRMTFSGNEMDDKRISKTIYPHFIYKQGGGFSDKKLIIIE